MQEKSVIYFNISLLSDEHLEGRNMHESRNSFSKTACSEVGHKVGHTGSIQTSPLPKKLPCWCGGGTRRPCKTTYLYNTSQELYFHISVLLNTCLAIYSQSGTKYMNNEDIQKEFRLVCSIGSWLMTYQQPLRLVHPSLISQVLCLVYSNFTNLQHTWNEVTNPLLKWGKWKGHHRSLVFNPS